MRRVMHWIMVLVVVMWMVPVYAAREGERGADAQALEHASDQAIFNRVGDWFAMVGKTKEEKQAILEERRAQRAAHRTEVEAKRAQREAEHETRKAAVQVEREAHRAAKEAERAGGGLRQGLGGGAKGN